MVGINGQFLFVQNLHRNAVDIHNAHCTKVTQFLAQMLNIPGSRDNNAFGTETALLHLEKSVFGHSGKFRKIPRMIIFGQAIEF
jgi:hypothetical protein